MLNDDQVKELKVAHKQTRDKRFADRIKAVLMLHFGFTFAQIKLALLLDEVTVRRYVKQFKTKGIDGLLEFHYAGGKSKLTIVQQNTLEIYLVSHTLTTAKEVSSYIRATYGKTYSLIGITKLLHRMGFTYKKPKALPGNASPALQEAFLKTYSELRGALGRNDQIYFSDATHPTHNTKPSYGWIKKGKKNDIYIKSNTGRKRLNVLGALNIGNKQAIVIEEETINAQAIIKLLEAVKEKQTHGKVFIVLDNAKYHHAKIVRNWLLHHARFRLIFLPPYSPNLNLIERLWRFFHQKVTNNRYFPTFQEFKEVTMTFFQNLHQYKQELETLLTENFQTLPTISM